jgi:diguanylate cyclase (GGDEF)-like protein
VTGIKGILKLQEIRSKHKGALMNKKLSSEKNDILILGEAFIKQLPEYLENIHKSWAEASAADGWNLSSANVLYLLLHNLVGVSGQFGLEEIRRNAKLIENEVFKATGDASLSDEQKNRINNLFQHLFDASFTDNEAHLPDLDLHISAVQSFRESRTNRLIYLVEDDPIQAKDLSLQISYFGYTVQTFNDVEGLERALKIQKPTAIIMDVVLPGGMTAGPDAIINMDNPLKLHVPIIFISESEMLQSRLQAVRAGGEAYFPKPVDIGKIIDALDRLTSQEVPEKYRIMIIEDSATQAAFTSKYLIQSGFETVIVTDPLQILQPLNDFNPDLILLDMYMPGCTGTELAAIIRQIEKFVSLPIIFLSAKNDENIQLDAMQYGGDDFLVKPIKGGHLIRSVTSRVERYRKLRLLMVHDGLTGLFNHTMLKDRLSQEILRARRQNTVLSYSMLDIDHFKQVNDTHGHAAGDQVLKSLARFLSQRMRATDIIGRYGGEEFGVILPDTHGAAALEVMDKIREGFSKIRHRSVDVEFSVTISCGVAAFPEFSTPAEISDAADKALYTAKNTGRNRVFLADVNSSG